ncbi:MAG TPA: hypothetical protein VKY41_07545 [Xanthomarina sp.]|nr:hypothetical protein [Xanthomarina sp.]
MKIYFKEEQKFSQWWLWLFLIGLGNIPIFGIYKQFILGEKFGDNPMSDLGLVLFSIFIFAIIALFWFMHLKTEIDEKGIRVDFLPFVKKCFLWTDLKSVKIINYKFVGYGLRYSSMHGTVYNTKGDKGMSLELFDGRKYVIGTQKDEELQEILNKILASCTIV